MAQLPHFIIKTSKRWYQNTLTGAYISAHKISAYLDKKSVDPKVKDEAIRKQRFDLNMD